MGGALTVLSLCQTPEADAGVIWYGAPPLEYVDPSRIKVPVMGHFAIKDAFFPLATVELLEDRLTHAGVRYTGHRYDAHHAFANDTAQGATQLLPETVYDARAAETAWDRSFRFLGSTLG